MERVEIARFVVDRHHRLCEWNALAESLTGWPAAEILGRPITDVLPLLLADEPANAPPAMSRDSTVDPLRLHSAEESATVRADDGEPHISVLGLRRKDGRIRQVAFQIVLPDGSCSSQQRAMAFNGGFNAYFADVSEIRHATDMQMRSGRVAESEERHAFLLRLSDALRDLGDPVDVQETAARVLGESLLADRVFYSSVIERDGKPFFHIERIFNVPSAPMLPIETEANPGNRFAADFQAGRTLVVDDIATDPRMLADEVKLYRERLINAWVSVPLVKSGRLVACLVVHQCTPRHWTRLDIARIEETAERTWAAVERARSEELVRLHAEALAVADRNKNHFINALSHELRNPLNTITLSLDMLELAPETNERIRTAVATMKRQAVHLTRIVNDLLDVSRIANNKIQITKAPVDLSELLHRCVADFMPQFRLRGITLVSSLPERPVVLQADAVRLTQVFGNLLQNALKFTHKNGAVSLSASVDAAANDVCIMVSDTGVGIDPAMLPHVFEPFSQAEQSLARSQGGLGLGLSIVRGIVERHGGTADVFSEGKDKGTCFVIHLPVRTG